MEGIKKEKYRSFASSSTWAVFVVMELYSAYNVNRSQFNMNCSNFTDYDWKSLNLARSIGTMIGTVISLAILLFLVYNKFYSSLFQRLYLYLIIATLVSEISGVISIEHQWHYEGQEEVCEGLGFFLAWTYVLTFIFSYEIIAYLLYLVVSKIGGTQLPQCGFRDTRCCGVIVEIMYIAIPVIVSTVFALPPLIQHKYGIAGPWCFVRSLNDSCYPTGKSAQIAFYSMYMTLGVAGIVASLIFLVVYFKLANSFKEVRYLLKRTLCVLGFKFIHILLILCSVACRGYTLQSQRHAWYGLWLAHALAFPVGALVFPLGYFLCFHHVGQIVRKGFKKLACKCLKHDTSLNRVAVPSITAARWTTMPRSECITQPSDTYFIVPHSESEPEKSALASDTGYYGSISFMQ